MPSWIDETVDDFEAGNYRLVGPIGSAVGAGLRGAEVASGIELGDFGVGGVGGDTVTDAGGLAGELTGTIGQVFGGSTGIPTGDTGGPNAGIPGVADIRGLIQLFLSGMLILVALYALGNLFEFQFVFDGE